MSHLPETRIPLILGVTGHRRLDPAQLEPLRAAVRQVFAQLRRDYPHTPLVLLSPLAGGADQIVAQVALEPASGVQVVAVLPWSAERSHSASSPHGTNEPTGERGECVELLGRAQQVVAVPLLPQVSAADLERNEADRQAQYDQVGRYIARYSQVLIAAWDGVESATSHASQVVSWFRTGAPAPYSARVGELDSGVRAAVCHLAVRRENSSAAGELAAPADEASTVEPLLVQWEFPHLTEPPVERRWPKSPLARIGFAVRSGLLAVHRGLHAIAHRAAKHEHEQAGEAALRRRWQSIDRFNADIADLPAVAAKTLADSRAYLIQDATAASLGPCLHSLRELYARADTAAQRWQGRTWWTAATLFGIAFVAVASLETYAHLVHETYFLFSYLVMLGLGYGVFRWAHRAELQGRWLDYRALAEALRVQIFWRWGGLDDCVADHYLRHFRGELDWIRHAARAAFLISGGHQPSADGGERAGAAAESFQPIMRYWVTDQRDYFVRKAPHNGELEIAFETGVKLAFFAAVASAFYHLMYHSATQHMSHLLVLVTFGCLLVAALLEEYADIQAYALLARRYRWMADLFGNAHDKLRGAFASGEDEREKSRRARGILFELGQEALTENADWVIQHRERPPILPGG